VFVQLPLAIWRVSLKEHLADAFTIIDLVVSHTRTSSSAPDDSMFHADVDLCRHIGNDDEERRVGFLQGNSVGNVLIDSVAWW
jgi:hypothetical protein